MPSSTPFSALVHRRPAAYASYSAAGSVPAALRAANPVITARSTFRSGGAPARAPGRAKRTDALAPPKAKLFESAMSIDISRASFGT